MILYIWFRKNNHCIQSHLPIHPQSQSHLPIHLQGQNLHVYAYQIFRCDPRQMIRLCQFCWAVLIFS
ncbi:hypothetical protein Avbf_05848, partial [Armadillidium vulgare]